MTCGIIEKSAKVTTSDLEKIRQFTRKDFPEEELYIFNVTLCDNDVDRDYEKFSVDALFELAELFKGKTGIFDHNMKCENQKARVFDTFVEKVDGQKTIDNEDYYRLRAKAYMVKSEENSSLIMDIDAGIKKEVSVSCSMKSAKCSICGKNKREGTCNHQNGNTYSSKLAYSVLSDATDAYEWSFVAVPAQRKAGVTKSFSKEMLEINMNDITKSLKEAENKVVLSKDEAKKVTSYIENLENEATLGQEYKENLVKEVTKLCAIYMPQMDLETFKGVADVMTTKELLCFKDAFKKASAKNTCCEPQLMALKKENKNNNSQFRI